MSGSILMVYGPVIFDVTQFNTHEYNDEGGAALARKDVIGARPALEFMGPNEQTYHFKGRIFPTHPQGRGGGNMEMALLEMIRDKGLTNFLMRGDGTPLGWFTIENVSRGSRFINKKGVGQVQEFTIDLVRDEATSAEDYMAGIMG